MPRKGHLFLGRVLDTGCLCRSLKGRRLPKGQTHSSWGEGKELDMGPKAFHASLGPWGPGLAVLPLQHASSHCPLESFWPLGAESKAPSPGQPIACPTAFPCIPQASCTWAGMSMNREGGVPPGQAQCPPPPWPRVLEAPGLRRQGPGPPHSSPPGAPTRRPHLFKYIPKAASPRLKRMVPSPLPRPRSSQFLLPHRPVLGRPCQAAGDGFNRG